MLMRFPFINLKQALYILRVVLALLLMAHGAMRLYLGTVGGFGEFLGSKGFPFGTVLAWIITAFELGGGSLLLINRWAKWISLGFMIELSIGIILVHFLNGWFVVGASSGGMEYSVLLIICFLVTAANDSES